MSQLKKTYGINTLVDEIGEPVDHNLPDQADMCEIVRAVIAAGLFAPITTDVTEIPFEALNYIDCPGPEGGPKICAANGISFYKSDMWTIMLDGMFLSINGFPKFIKAGDHSRKYEIPSDPGEPIDRSAIEAAVRLKSPSDDELQRLISSAKDFTLVDKRRPEDPMKRVYIKYSTFKTEIIQANAGWNFFNSGNIELTTNTDIYAICYSMISGYARKSRLAVRLVLDDVAQISTRMIQGYMDNPAITTAFVSQLQVGVHRLQTQYRVSANLSLDNENKDTENIITGMIVIPTGGLFINKIINPREFQLFNDNSWSDFPNLNTKVKLDKTAYIIVLYNLSMPGMQSHLISRVDINTRPILVI